MNSIKLIQTKEILTTKDLNNFELTQFPNHTGDNRATPGYLVILNDEAVFFSVLINETAFFDRSLKAGGFHKDLWKQDVAEIFFASDHHTQYQEFNFSPGGAYWQCQFSDYRKRIDSTEKEVSGLLIEVQALANTRRLNIKIPRSAILPDCSLKNGSKINCAVILGQSPRNYSYYRDAGQRKA